MQIDREHIKCDPMQATDKRIAKNRNLSIVHSTNAAVCRAHGSQPEDGLVVGQVPQLLGARLTLPAIFCARLFIFMRFQRLDLRSEGPLCGMPQSAESFFATSTVSDRSHAWTSRCACSG